MKPYSCRLFVVVVLVLLVSGTSASRSAFAQTEKGWQVDVAPLYFWAATTDGNLAINGTRSVPVYMDFADTASKLAGAFALHVEARKGRWGLLGDVNFVRLSSDADFTTPVVDAPIAGTLKLDQLIFNAKLMYEVKPGTKFLLVGGIRTMSMSPSAHFTGPVGGQLADIDVNTTVVAGVGGFVYRPKLASQVTLLTQADLGGGSAFTWSALAGLQFQVKPWIALAAGYNVLRIDTGNVPKTGNAAVSDLQYAVTQHGPAFSLAFRWAAG
jgi:opacity protein-like surface antigen